MKEHDYLKKLGEIYKEDNEIGHIHADKLLIKIIKHELGYPKLVELYKKMRSGFWYA